MRFFSLFILISAVFVTAEERKVVKGFLVDQKCALFYLESQLEKLPEHTKGCVKACGVDAGFGLVENDVFIPFGERGNKLASEWLERTPKHKELRIEVTFLVDGNKYIVERIEGK